MGSSGECAYQLQEDGADKRSTNGKETEGPTRRKQNKNNSESRKKKAESRGGRDEGGEVEREREREREIERRGRDSNSGFHAMPDWEGRVYR